MKKVLLTLLAFLGMSTANYAQVTFTAVAGSDFEDGEGSAKAFDGNTGTKWCKDGSENCYLIVEASEATYIKGFTMTTANDNESYEGRTPKEYKIYGSDAQDGTYELIYHQTDDNYIGDKNFTDYTIYCNSAKQYKFFKLQILSSNLNGSTLFQISEFKLLPSTVGFAYQEGAEKAFDGTTGEKWEGSTPTSVTVKATAATYLTGYQFTSANDNKSWTGRNPSDWKIEGSNDNTNWTEIVSVSGNTDMADVNYTPYYFNLSTPPAEAYEYFKVTVTKAQGGGYFQMGELALIGDSNAHNWVEKGQEDPTCFAVGHKILECSFCGATKYGDEIAKIDHDFDSDKGLCNNCGYPQENFMTTNDGWYEPTGVDHFNWLAATVKYVDQTVKIRLTQDVDLTGFAGFGNGSDAMAYKGELNGNGHWLKNLTIDTNANCTGLFGRTDGAKIHDLGLTGCSVKTSLPNGGVLAGNMKDTDVNRVAVMSSYAESRDHVGAIAGNTDGTTVISNCLSDSEVHSTAYQAGGFVGTTSGLTLTKCLFTGKVTNDNYAVSGLVSLLEGNNNSTTISYNIAAATSLETNSNNIDDLYSITNTNGRTATYTHNCISSATERKYNNGESDDSSKTFDEYDGAKGKTFDEAAMQVKSFFTDELTWDMENDWKFIATGKYPVLAWMPAESTQTITIGKTGYATVTSTEVLDFSSVTGLKAYAAQTKENYIHLEQLTDVPSGTAFIVKGDEGDHTIPFAVEKLSDMPDNDLKVSDGTVQGGSSIFVLADKSKGVGFYPTAESITVPENKGYLQITLSGETRSFIGFEDDQTTGIGSVDNGNPCEGAIYTISGQRVSKLQKGINIVNGKKIMY